MGRMQSGGIAGVASLADGAAIKTVNDQSRYKLWEFVYDMSEGCRTADGRRSESDGSSRGCLQSGQHGLGQGSGTPGNSGFGNSGFGNSNSGFGNSNTN